MFRRIEKCLNSDLKPVLIISHGVSSFRGNNNQFFFPRLQNTFEALFLKDFAMLPSFEAPYVVVQVWQVCGGL